MTRHCPFDDEPMEVYKAEHEDEPTIWSCPECGFEEEES